MEEGNEKVLNAVSLPPAIKHKTILETFEGLEPGESFILHNDHDPKPLYYQFSAEKGDIFTWEYLKQGPDIFEIRIGKKGPAGEKPSEKVLDVTRLERGTKHKTVLDTFDQLQEGGSFILHNDHDPKPLYYQFHFTRKNQFVWDYLKQGPDVFDIRISKRQGGEKVLNAIELSAAEKHKTIVGTFEQLKEGESFILHNDHDPKPLYYQLSAERGDIFTWDYLKQGPEIFEIRIGKKVLGKKPETKETRPKEKTSVYIDLAETGRETVSTIVAQDLRKIQVFINFGIDCFWHAQKTLEEACEETGTDLEELETALEQATLDNPETLTSQNHNLWDMEFLADYILKTHHRYVKDYYEPISSLAEKVSKSQGETHPELKKLGVEVRPMIKDFMDHMGKEESALFPAIKKMSRLLAEEKKPEMMSGGIANAIERMEAEHDETGEALMRFREITNDYELPADADEDYRLLFKLLEEFERDTYLHVHLENNILFPKTILLEQKLLGK